MVRHHAPFHLFDKLKTRGNSINTRSLNNQLKTSHVKFILPHAGKVKL